MGLKDKILQKGLKIVDNTVGKKHKWVDDVTDIFQGSEARMDDLEERIIKLEEISHAPRDFVVCDVCKNKIKETDYC